MNPLAGFFIAGPQMTPQPLQMGSLVALVVFGIYMVLWYRLGIKTLR